MKKLTVVICFGMLWVACTSRSVSSEKQPTSIAAERAKRVKAAVKDSLDYCYAKGEFIKEVLE